MQMKTQETSFLNTKSYWQVVHSVDQNRWIAFLTILTLVLHVQAAVCQLQMSTYVIAQTSTAQFTLTVGQSQTNIDKIQLIFPDTANFNIDTIQCSEIKYTYGDLKFIQPAGPICSVQKALSTDNQNNIISITNQKGLNNIIQYEISISNMINPLAGQTVKPICKSFKNNVQVESYTISGMLPFTPVITTIGLSMSSSPSINGQSSSFIVSFITGYTIPIGGGIAIILPLANKMYSTKGVPPQDMLSDGLVGLTITAKFVSLISYLNPFQTLTIDYPLGTLTSHFRESSVTESVLELYFSNVTPLPKTGILIVTISQIINPPCTYPLSGIKLTTGQKYVDNLGVLALYLIETCISTNAVLTNTKAETLDPLLSVAKSVPDANVSVTGVTYNFSITTKNDIPVGGFLQLTVPSPIGVPGASSMQILCYAGCVSSQIVITWDATNRFMVLTNTSGFYMPKGLQLNFDLKGFTNPPTSVPQYFDFATYAVLDTGNYIIDQSLQVMFIKAIQGFCNVKSIKPTDDNRIYALPGNYTFEMSSVTSLSTTDGIRIVLPSDFYVIPNSRCTVGLQNTRYICNSYNTTNSIEIYQFSDSVIQSDQVFKFTVDSIINPGTKGVISGNPFKVYSISSTNTTIDSCEFKFPDNYFQNSNISQFNITPVDKGVGQFPARYHFELNPNGDIWAGSSLLITMPDEISIYSKFAFENSCASNIYGFTYSQISCRLSNNQIWVERGFATKTSNVTTTVPGQLLQTLIPTPQLKFDLTGFVNPRSTQSSKPWNITIVDSNGQAYYYWQYPYGPNVTMSGAAQPRSFTYARNSKQNGNITDYNFTVSTMNYLQDGDTLIVDLPYPTFYSEDSSCYANSRNLLDFLPCKVSVDLSKITLTLKLPTAYRNLEEMDQEQLKELQQDQVRRNLQTVKRILSGDTFSFRISKIQNPFSFMPTEQSIKYSVFTDNGFLIEQTIGSFLLRVNNTVPGYLPLLKTQIMPSDFRQGFIGNYTVTISPVNYQQNMRITIQLPKQINFSNKTTTCIGLAGVDQPNLNCTINKNLKQVTITDAVTYQRGNPEKIKILLTNLRNPSENIITDSFIIKTQTSTNYTLDEVTSNLTANFYCEYPCMSCNQNEKTLCNSCYLESPFAIFFDAKCIAACPELWVVNITTNNCTACIDPCLTCTGNPTNCTACVDGFWKIASSNTCHLKVYYPFPFLLTGLIMFVLIGISEIYTKAESRFKEAFIALVSLPEIFAWITYIVFLFSDIGYKTFKLQNNLLRVPTMLAVLAFGTYCLINFSHALMHPRKMVPNAMPSYQILVEHHQGTTRFHWAISYLVSFKYSLILVSYMWNQPQYKGDYSAANWIQFNRISFSFVFISYPIMMASCCYYLASIGFWSYTGFVACEVILLSTVLAVLMLLDALSSVKCKTIGKVKSNRAAKVASGVDYESDEDERPSRRAMKYQKHVMKRSSVGPNDSLGYDDSQGSEVSFGGKNKKQNKAERLEIASLSDFSRRDGSVAQTAYMDEETRKQIIMLEELAQQMREEKEEIRLEQQRIERERARMQAEREQQEYHLEQYMADYSKQTHNLGKQVKELEVQKKSLVTQVDQRLSESRSANKMLIKKLSEMQTRGKSTPTPTPTPLPVKKSFRNFESEMEDYEPVEEEKEEHEVQESNEYETVSEPEIMDPAELPLRPAFGEIDYYRNVEGEDQHWMQQITPRQGGDSMLGQHDVQDTGMDYFVAQQAEYDMVSAPPTREGEQQREFYQSPGSYDQMESQMNISENDSELFHARSDAAMEINSVASSKHDTEQDYFVPDSPVYSVLKDKLEASISQEYIVPEKAQFGRIAETDSLHGEEQQYFCNEHAIAGDDYNLQERDGQSQRFFRKEEALHEELQQEAKQYRQATPQTYFQNQIPIAAQTNYGRSTQGNEQFFQPDRPIYSSNGAENLKENNLKQEYFRRENALVKQLASEAGKSALGESQDYIEAKSAFRGQDESPRVMLQDTHNFFQKEDALFQKENGQISKNATGEDFFKHDDAARGEISLERSVDDSQRFFNNVQSAEFGIPDEFKRIKTDGQEFIDRKPLSRQQQPGAKGRTTPQPLKEDDPLEYFDKSEAEYGRQSTRQQRDADKEQFFDNEKAFAGKMNDYKRQKQVDQEFNPPASEDISGKSVSGESEVANHAPFNALTDFVNSQAKEKAVPHFTPKPTFKEDVIKPIPQHRQVEEQKQRRQVEVVDERQHRQVVEEKSGKKRKTIIYSDKSESSVDEMMADTPSNYNIPNGRLDGKSMGLKAVMMRSKMTTQLNPISEQLEHQPVISNSGQLFNRGSYFDPNNHQQQRQFVNNLTGQDQRLDNAGGVINQPGIGRHQFIAEESSGQEHTSGHANSQARRNRIPKTNKNFLEGSSLQNPQLTLQQQQLAQRQLQFMKNNFV